MIEVNGLAHVILTVSQWAKARAFYGELLPFLGMKKVYDGNNFLYHVGGRTAVGIQRCAPEHEGARFAQNRVGLHHFCLRARSREDVDKVAAKLRTMGAPIDRGPLEGDWAPGYYFLVFEDPDGIRLEVNFIPGKGLLASDPPLNPSADPIGTRTTVRVSERRHASTEDRMPDLFETMESCRAMRRLKPDPVPDDVVSRILQAGVCAPSGGNTQKWRFLVIRDAKIKQAVQALYKRAFDEWIGPRYLESEPPPGVTKERYLRQREAVSYLTDHFHEAPVWIVACLEDGPNPSRSAGASIYPAVQNMLLAARALGLGTTLTTRHLFYEKEAEAALGLPPGVHSYAILPIGYPMGRFGPVKRAPLAEVVYQDRWGEPYRGV